MRVDIPGVIERSLEAHTDDRGRFVEIVRNREWPAVFVQSNHSSSRAGVLRGIHWHRSQSDLWYLVRGTLQVALVDLRDRGDPVTTTWTWSAESPSALFIPPGVAHGFLALTDVDLIYWVSAEYDASDEFGLAWDDPALGIDWQMSDPVLSERDRTNQRLSWAEIPEF